MFVFHQYVCVVAKYVYICRRTHTYIIIYIYILYLYVYVTIYSYITLRKWLWNPFSLNDFLTSPVGILRGFYCRSLRGPSCRTDQDRGSMQIWKVGVGHGLTSPHLWTCWTPFNFNSHQQGRPFLCVPSSPLFILLVGIFSIFLGGVISQLLLLRCHPGMPSTTSSYALKRSLATVQCTPGWTSENLRSIASQPMQRRVDKMWLQSGVDPLMPGRQWMNLYSLVANV